MCREWSVLKNGDYYPICNYDKYSNMAFLRVDKMSDIEITDKESKDIGVADRAKHAACPLDAAFIYGVGDNFYIQKVNVPLSPFWYKGFVIIQV